ncbi:MAG: DUF5686 and carboxypeptidase regulatory-like domain-containing protein [bacterium]|nr:DUF5686 and carboxypeptidase regulatory-like domain-containing protein [bacterium]
MRKCLFFFLLIAITSATSAQKIVVSGKVIESRTGAAVPFATVAVKGTTLGSITDFDGNYRLELDQQYDSIEVSYIGFVSKTKSLDNSPSQIINFQLEEDVVNLSEVVVYAGENPAFEILRNVVKNKKFNDKRSLSAFEYESYTKIEADVDNLSDKFKNRKVVQKITQIIDSIEHIAGEDGKPILPLFISEAISRYYYKKDPTFRHEKVLKTKVSGVGITDGTLTSQVIGSTFQEYNFYQNWLNIVSKEFVSPIADAWKQFYEYDLTDSLYLEDDFVYRLDFFPKRSQDLAFRGTMWITKDDWALKRIDCSVDKGANLNFVEKIKVQQDLVKTEAGAWIPEKSRIIVDISQVTKKTAGMIFKFYVSAKDIVVNQPYDNEFYQNPVTMEEDVREDSDLYWNEHRHDSLTSTEVNVYKMIDSLKRIPLIKFGTDASKWAATGYYKVRYVELGHWATAFGKNNIEGVRLGFGAKTSIDFSNRWVLGGYFGYGFDDKQWKYQSFAQYIINRNKWTTIRLERQEEVEQIWLLNENIGPSSLFYSFSRFGTLTQPFSIEKNILRLETQLAPGLTQKVELKNESFNPLFDFQYYTSPNESNVTGSNFDISEVSIDTRWAKDEVFVINDNDRLSLGTNRYPAINLKYTYGFKGFLGSDFNYHKLNLSVQKRQKMALLGVADIRLNGGYIFSQVPYPLLTNHLGNETPIYASFTYNLMDFFEFSSDRFVELRYRHQFEGLILNRIPLFKRLKWRLTGTANVLYGGMSQQNLDIIPTSIDAEGNEVLPFNTLDTNKPYVELGYGVENIFKIFRVDAFHRLTYTNKPGVNNFGLKFSLQLIL